MATVRSQEEAEERNREKLDRLEEKRLRAFERGLKSLSDLEYDTLKDGDADSLLKIFKKDSTRELKRIMAEADAASPYEDK